tara:strand:- start:121 stop:1077 length:957 start_codon:yes stop_codon:yes gene_type:complete
MLPIIESCKGVLEYRTLFTGQHEDLVKTPSDLNLKISKGRNRLDAIMSSVMNSINFEKERITSVMVQGDTTTALAVALTAFHHKVPVIHLEAGLRTMDYYNPYPEEVNRQLIARIAKLNLCPTNHAAKQLAEERVHGMVYTVGNTVLDNLKNVQTSYENKVLITLHRRENHEIMRDWFDKIEKLAQKYKDYEFLFPIHPNPKVKKHEKVLKKVKVVEPLSHNDLIDYMKDCKIVITDSGGIQEESSYLKKKSIVCRKTTERVEGKDIFSFLCETPEHLEELFDNMVNNYMIDLPCPYGTGDSGKKIVDILTRDDWRKA